MPACARVTTETMAAPENLLTLGVLISLARDLSFDEFQLRLGHPLAILAGPPKADSARQWAFVTTYSHQTEGGDSTEYGDSWEAYVVRKGEAAGALQKGLFKGTIFIGRAPSNDVVIDDLSVSKIHVKLRPTGDCTFELEDAASTNGTSVDKTLVLPGQPVMVAHGASIHLGTRTFSLFDTACLYRRLRGEDPR